MKLLLIDDEPFLRKATQRVLSTEGVEVIPFASPAECDAYLAEHGWEAIRWIVSDNSMPKETGSAWFLRRRAEIEARKIRFVLVTGDPRFSWEHTPWLPKPFERAELLKVVYQA